MPANANPLGQQRPLQMQTLQGDSIMGQQLPTTWVVCSKRQSPQSVSHCRLLRTSALKILHNFLAYSRGPWRIEKPIYCGSQWIPF